MLHVSNHLCRDANLSHRICPSPRRCIRHGHGNVVIINVKHSTRCRPVISPKIGTICSDIKYSMFQGTPGIVVQLVLHRGDTFTRNGSAVSIPRLTFIKRNRRSNGWKLPGERRLGLLHVQTIPNEIGETTDTGGCVIYQNSIPRTLPSRGSTYFEGGQGGGDFRGAFLWDRSWQILVARDCAADVLHAIS